MTDDERPIPESEEPEATKRRRGCIRPVVWTLLIGGGVLAALIVAFWFLVGSSQIEELIARRVESTLEARMGRDVQIGNIEIHRGRLTSVVLEDVRIPNVEGASHPWFAIIPRIVIEGGVESFRQRVVRVGTVEIHEPEVFIEIFPEDAPLTHNVPDWKTGEPARFEIAQFEMNEIDVTGARVVYQDHRRELEADLRHLSGTLEPDTENGEVSGFLHAERARIDYRDWEPFDANLRTGFHFGDRKLTLRRTRLRSEGLTVDLGGVVVTEAEASADLEIEGSARLMRIREILGLDQEIEGTIAFDTNLQIEGGMFDLTGNATSERISAAGYELGEVSASLAFDESRAEVEIERATYGGGTVTGAWRMASYDDPRPMTVDLDYDSVALEALLGDWNLAGSGLRGSARGSIHYEFEQDAILEGDGSGRAVLEPGAIAFGRAPYPMPVEGRTQFDMSDGVLRFDDPSVLRLPRSDIRFEGTLVLESLASDLTIRADSEDLAELDRLGVNFAHALGSEDFELLGLGGSGTVTATVEGTLGEPTVNASIDATDGLYNNVPIGTAKVQLTWNGSNQTLTFEEGSFARGDATLELTGTIRFPEGGEPAFDLAMSSNGWPVQEAIDLVDLELDGVGTATGRLEVDGTPEQGLARFEELVIRDEGSRLTLNGDVRWLPGEGNLAFDLDVGAEMFPASEIAEFLDLGTLPVEGAVTGTLHLEGPIESLEGAGSVTLRDGTIAGEPVEEAVADLRFTDGSLDVRHFTAEGPAGSLIGQATYDFEGEQFSFVLEPTRIDLSRIEALSDFDLVEGTVLVTASGAGSPESPEFVLDATLVEGSILGHPIPEGASAPELYFALRGGDLVIQGSAFDALTISGRGRVSEEQALSGDVNIIVTDMSRLMQIANPDGDVEIDGGLAVNLDLGGSIESIETIDVAGTVTRLDLEIGGEAVTAPEPVTFALVDGRLRLDSIGLRVRDTDFFVDGTVALTGTNEIDLAVRGDLRLSLLEIVTGDVDARGVLTVRAEVGGSTSSPRFSGTAELRDASVKLPAFPQLISNIYGSFVLRGDRVEIDSFRATLGGGSIVAGGFVTLQGLTPSRIRINAQGEDVTVRAFDGVTVAGDFDLLLSGDPERQQIRGDVVVDRAVYYEDFDLTELILEKVLERQALVPSIAETWQDDVSLRIDVTADDTLLIENNVADITASADLELAGSLGQPVILGRVTLNEGGTFTFQDVDYRILQGSISFQNPFRNDPYFDVTAEGTLKARGQTLGEIEEYDLTVNLTGTLDRIVPNISSDPAVGDLTLLTLLSGQVGGTAGVGESSFSASGTNLFLSQVGEAIGAKILPFADAVRFDTVGESGFNPTVTFEKQVSSDVFVIVIYDTDSTENVEIIQWQATEDWVIQFTRNSEHQNTYLINALDARFRRRYEGRW